MSREAASEPQLSAVIIGASRSGTTSLKQYVASHPEVVTHDDLEEQESSGERAGLWTMAFDNAKYPWLTNPWTSAMASGECDLGAAEGLAGV